MLNSKFNRQLVAFFVIVLASIFLYPVAEARLDLFTWSLLGLAALAALLTLVTK